jgi:hypothetical protein
MSMVTGGMSTVNDNRDMTPGMMKPIIGVPIGGRG